MGAWAAVSIYVSVSAACLMARRWRGGQARLVDGSSEQLYRRSRLAAGVAAAQLVVKAGQTSPERDVTDEPRLPPPAEEWGAGKCQSLGRASHHPPKPPKPTSPGCHCQRCAGWNQRHLAAPLADAAGWKGRQLQARRHQSCLSIL